MVYSSELPDTFGLRHALEATRWLESLLHRLKSLHPEIPIQGPTPMEHSTNTSADQLSGEARPLGSPVAFTLSFSSKRWRWFRMLDLTCFSFSFLFGSNLFKPLQVPKNRWKKKPPSGDLRTRAPGLWCLRKGPRDPPWARGASGDVVRDLEMRWTSFNPTKKGLGLKLYFDLLMTRFQRARWSFSNGKAAQREDISRHLDTFGREQQFSAVSGKRALWRGCWWPWVQVWWFAWQIPMALASSQLLTPDQSGGISFLAIQQLVVAVELFNCDKFDHSLLIYDVNSSKNVVCKHSAKHRTVDFAVFEAVVAANHSDPYLVLRTGLVQSLLIQVRFASRSWRKNHQRYIINKS